MLRRALLFIRKTAWRHKWVYPINGNPYRRTCSVCGQHQEYVCWEEDFYIRNRGWWEVWSDGDVQKHWIKEPNREPD